MTLLQEWLSREGHLVLSWWLWITLSGATVFPLCFRLLGGLPDRGYTLARPIGLLLITWLYWLLASYGFLDNSRGSIALAWIGVLIGSLLIAARGGSWQDAVRWWRENKWLILATELLFAAMLLGWAIYRAHQNEILYTEKPMELAFISAVQRSPAFPPQDPWMSGFAISYYYMGYVMSSLLSMLSGLGSAVAFNLTIASQFALTGLGAFGVAYNLIRSRAAAAPATRLVAIAGGILALLLMTLVGNLQTALIELPYQSRAAPQPYLEFWGTQERANFAEGAYEQVPGASLFSDASRWSYWWWFRASRVLTDYNLDGSLGGAQPINEFPAFSFLLADVHPHVLALPFALTMMGLMLNLALLRRRPQFAELLLYGIALGGLLFLNSWDAPIYLAGLLGAEGLRRLLLNNRGRLRAGDALQLLIFAAMLSGIALLAYLPFVIGFRSQAGGLLPNLAHPTAIQRFFIALGPPGLAVAAFLLLEAWRGSISNQLNWRAAIRLCRNLLIMVILLALGLMLIAAIAPAGSSPVQRVMALAGGWAAGLPQVIMRHLEYGLTALLLLIGIGLAWARLFPLGNQPQSTSGADEPGIGYPPATGFALLLIGMGLCLAFIPEFVYLQDNFGSRINTIFKFYYQVWALWSVASAYAVYSILIDATMAAPPRWLRLAWAALFALMMLAGLLYSLLGIRQRAWVEAGRQAVADVYVPPPSWTRPILQVSDGAVIPAGAILYSDGSLNEASQSSIIRARQGGIVALAEEGARILQPLTLDGARSFANQRDLEAINCLAKIVGRREAVVSEAVQNAYDAAYGRVGALTGIPIVLGWENHQRQWRGATYAAIAGTRRQDMERLYRAESMDLVSHIIARYGIDYIFYGATERRQYGDDGERKFLDHLPVVCQAGDARVFAVNPVVLAESARLSE